MFDEKVVLSHKGKVSAIYLRGQKIEINPPIDVTVGDIIEFSGSHSINALIKCDFCDRLAEYEIEYRQDDSTRLAYACQKCYQEKTPSLQMGTQNPLFILFTKDLARKILEMDYICFSEGQGPDIGNIITLIVNSYPELIEEYPYLRK